MNPLELLKDKLRTKQNIDEFKPIPITVPNPTSPEIVKISKIAIIDKQRESNFDIGELSKGVYLVRVAGMKQKIVVN